MSATEVQRTYALLDWIQEARWRGDVIEFRFGDDFDASSYWIEEEGRLLFRIGSREHRDVVQRLSLLLCRCFDAAGGEIDTFVIADLQRQYRTKIGGRTAGTNWMCFTVPHRTTSCFLFELVAVDGVWHSVGIAITPIEKADPL